MIRRCDGTDPNLIRYPETPAPPPPVVDDEVAPRLRRRLADGVPCDCGLVFDDVRRSTIFPHELV